MAYKQVLEEVRAALSRDPNLTTRQLADQLKRRHEHIVRAARHLRGEERWDDKAWESWNPPTRDDGFPPDEAPTAPFTPVIPADRMYVEKPAPTYTWRAPDTGSRTLSRLLLLPDIHAPYHDQRALDVALKFARAWRPDGIIDLGDFADCYSVSDHDKDPRRGTQLHEELAVVAEVREQLDDLGAGLKICTLGNHEDRYRRYLARQASALFAGQRIEEAMGLPQAGWQVVPYLQHGKIGKLYVTHEAGHSGVHAAHQTGQAFGASIAFGHTHQLGCTYFGDLSGGRHVGASLGWLGRMEDADYAPLARRRMWTHGFGTVLMEKSGNFHLTLHAIVDGRVVCAGEANLI